MHFFGATSLKGVPNTFTSVFEAICANIRSRVRAYGDVFREITSWPLSSLVPNFAIGMMIEMALSSCENNDIAVRSAGKLFDL